MALPSDIKTQVKDMMFIADTQRDAEIESTYVRALNKMVREIDITTQKETIDTVASQSIYDPDPQAYRILMILYNKTIVRKATSDGIDWTRQTWESESDGTPDYWFTDNVPKGLDSIINTTGMDFAVVPPPDSAKTGESGLVCFENIQPNDDDPAETYLNPPLIYQTIADMLTENSEEANEDEDIRDQTALQVASFFQTLADTWKAVIKSRVPS
jgi:hypothetical protein